MIAVTGATGTIGSELVRLLAGRGLEVRALTRRAPDDPDASGVNRVQVDLADRAALTTALTGCRSLFLLTGNSDDMVRLQKNAIRAGVACGVDLIVKLSALGASDHSRSVIGLWHFNVERELRSAGVRWTILRPHHFMQNFLDPLVFDRQSGTVHSSSGDGAIPFIDTRDIASVAAHVLTHAGHDQAIHTLTGPSAISFADATTILGRLLGRHLTFIDESVDDAWRRRRAFHQPLWLAAAQLAIAEYQRAGGPTAVTTDSTERIIGKPPRSFETFVTDHRDQLERHAR